MRRGSLVLSSIVFDEEEAILGRQFRVFPWPTRLIGWLLALLGVIVVVLNLIAGASNVHLLPAGHSPLWLAGGVVVVLAGMILIGIVEP